MCVEGGGRPVLSCAAVCVVLVLAFCLSVFVSAVGGLVLDLCVFVVGLRHAFRSELPYYY